MKDKPWFAVVYMFLITAFFSSVVIGFARVTRQRVEANQKLAFEQAVLEAFSLAQDKNPQQIHETFTERIGQPRESSHGAYLLKENGEVTGYAVGVAGKGFWAPIKGIVGIDVDKRTITGIAFYEQNETPGLGAQITTPEFRDQFAEKVIAATDNAIAIKPFGSPLLGDNEVHAITGATQTCARLEKLINDDLTKWRDAMAAENQDQ